MAKKSENHKPLEIEEGELTLDYDATINKVQEWNASDSERASDAGVTRQDIGAFQKETGVNSKALSHFRQITKMKKESDKRDYVRSMESLLEYMKQILDGNGTPDMLDAGASK